MSDKTAAEDTELGGLIVLDGDAAERVRIEAMAEELGVEIWAAAPDDLVPERPDTWESLTQARAVVVAASFGPRSGLEIIEALAWSEGNAPPVRALGLDRCHRAWLEAAFRAGATTCVLRPFDPEELKTKVIGAIAGAAGAGEAAPAEADEVSDEAEGGEQEA